jgi:hypothetical protein
MKRPKLMICCCCGSGCMGRQWWNRDTGYAICVACADQWAANPKVGPKELARSCGVRGVHYAINDLPTEAECKKHKIPID